MKYKAIAHIPGLTPGGEVKAQQIFGDTYSAVSDWASVMLASSPIGTRVDVYEVEEKLKQTFTKKGSGEEKA